MARVNRRRERYQVVELDGVRYAILREALLLRLLRKAGGQMHAPPASGDQAPGYLEAVEHFDSDGLARRLVARREELGLSQAELARKAGIRVETLNRLERGRTTPDFSTIRKLVVAMKQAAGAART